MTRMKHLERDYPEHAIAQDYGYKIYLKEKKKEKKLNVLKPEPEQESSQSHLPPEFVASLKESNSFF